jgi:hypothetical protein
MENQKETDQPETGTAAASPVDVFVMRCGSCRYWQGDKEKAAALYKDNPISMDLFKGWPNTGGCGIEYEWLDTEIHGDAFVTHVVEANFGCVYYGA